MDNQDRIKLFADACKESLEVATDNKVGGLGIGRFGALQIGRNTLNGHMIQKEKRILKYSVLTKLSFSSSGATRK